MIGKLRAALAKPVDGASLCAFRAASGAVMALEALCGLYWLYNGRFAVVLDPNAFHFTYYGFGWVKPCGPAWIFVLCLAAFVSGLGVMAGSYQRACAAVFCAISSYFFLIEKAIYVNHHYLICLLAFLMMFIPASGHAKVPALWLYLLRAQIGLVYAFAGLAKLNADWLQGYPLRLWLSAGAYKFPAFLPPVETALIMSWAGLLLDLFVVPLLLWKKTRAAGFALAAAFHLFNAAFLEIGFFPWLMIAATALFFEPDWPRKAGLMKKSASGGAAAPRPSGGALAAAAVYLALQLALPLRPYLYPGNSLWTDQGDYFSWRMLLVDKEGSLRFFASEPGRAAKEIDPRHFLKEFQAIGLETDTDMILQFARHLAMQLKEKEGWSKPEIKVRAEISLNGRRPQLIADPRIDLAAQPRNLRRKTWILPLTEPLP